MEPHNPSDTTAAAVLATIEKLGEATAAAIAETSGVAYSTTNKKLRLLESAGVAQASRGSDTKVRWKLTDTDPAHNTHAGADAEAHQGEEPEPGDTQPRLPERTSNTEQAPPGDEYPTTLGPDGSGEQDNDLPYPVGADNPAEPGTSEPQTIPPATGDKPTAPVDAASDNTQAAAATDDIGDSGTVRRRPGALYNEVITVLQRQPDQVLKVADIRKQVDTARNGAGGAAASAGAVYNALLKAVNDGVAQQVGERPATFRAV